MDIKFIETPSPIGNFVNVGLAANTHIYLVKDHLMIMEI